MCSQVMRAAAQRASSLIEPEKMGSNGPMKNVMADKMNPYPTFFLGWGVALIFIVIIQSSVCPFFIFSRDFQLSLARYTLP
jgi:hypothetical protein